MKTISLLALGLAIISESSYGQNFCRGRHCPSSGPATNGPRHERQPRTPVTRPNHGGENHYRRPPVAQPGPVYRPGPVTRPNHDGENHYRRPPVAQPGPVYRPGPVTRPLPPTPRYGDYNNHRHENHNRNLWQRNRDLYNSNYILRDRNEELYRRSITNYSRFYHLPDWRHLNSSYRPYNHAPYRHSINHHQNWRSPLFYHRALPFSSIYFWNWIRVRVAYENGYQLVNNYPYYVYDGYSHRYSNYDSCNYELVDGYSNTVVTNYHSLSCQIGYDACATRRDQLNYETGRSQYFCSERFEYDRNHNYNWDYDRDFYSSVDDGYNNY